MHPFYGLVEGVPVLLGHFVVSLDALAYHFGKVSFLFFQFLQVLQFDVVQNLFDAFFQIVLLVGDFGVRRLQLLVHFLDFLLLLLCLALEVLEFRFLLQQYLHLLHPVHRKRPSDTEQQYQGGCSAGHHPVFEKLAFAFHFGLLLQLFFVLVVLLCKVCPFLAFSKINGVAGFC